VLGVRVGVGGWGIGLEFRDRLGYRWVSHVKSSDGVSVRVMVQV